MGMSAKEHLATALKMLLEEYPPGHSVEQTMNKVIESIMWIEKADADRKSKVDKSHVGAATR